MVSVIAYNIRSLYNVGSIFRTADAFGISRIYLTGYTGRPDEHHNANKISKVALGAEKSVPWEYHRSAAKLINKLKKDRVRIVGLENNIPSDRRLIPLSKFKTKYPCALVLGEETKGIPKPILKLCDDIVDIPMRGQKESLNVSVAFGVAAYSLIHP